MDRSEDEYKIIIALLKKLRLSQMESKEHFQQTISKWIEEERSWTCGEKSSDIYARNQGKRFYVTLDICKKHVPNQSAHVLDIGRSNLTNLLSQYYKDVSTLGFDLEKDDGGHRENIIIPNLPHIVYDLNESKNTGSWPNYPQVFDLIVFCETLEHLYIAPEYVLLMLKYLLSPKGIIVMTTPNAASFHKRVIFLWGKNPAERLRFYQMNPGDYRQYTREEVIDIADKSGLRIVECRNINFRSSRHPVVRVVQKIPKLKDSIYAILSR